MQLLMRLSVATGNGRLEVLNFVLAQKSGLPKFDVGNCELIKSVRSSCQHPEHEASGRPTPVSIKWCLIHQEVAHTSSLHIDS